METFIESKITMTCKVCSGTGTVRIGYYQHPTILRQSWSSLTIGKETCRNCDGIGQIVI